MNNTEICLSKWWTTLSAQAAFRRVEEHRKERIAKVREHFASKQKELIDAVNNWEAQHENGQ